MDLLLSNFIVIIIIKHRYNNDRGSKVTGQGQILCRLDARDSAPSRWVWGHAPPRKIFKFQDLKD